MAPTTAPSVNRDIVAGVSTPLSPKACKGDGRREVGVELRDLCVLTGALEVACKAAAQEGDCSRELPTVSETPDRRGVFIESTSCLWPLEVAPSASWIPCLRFPTPALVAAERAP